MNIEYNIVLYFGIVLCLVRSARVYAGSIYHYCVTYHSTLFSPTVTFVIEERKKKTKLASKMIDFQTTINVIRPQCITFEIMVNCFFTEGIWSDVSSKLLKRVWISTTMKKALTYGSWHQAGLPVRLNAKVGNITTLPFTNVKTI